jgi:hypothetical protein
LSKDFLLAAADGKTYRTKFYNLDVIISVGYRVHSRRGTQFRQWATARLRELVLKGFSIDPARIAAPQAAGRDVESELLADEGQSARTPVGRRSQPSAAEIELQKSGIPADNQKWEHVTARSLCATGPGRIALLPVCLNTALPRSTKIPPAPARKTYGLCRLIGTFRKRGCSS